MEPTSEQIGEVITALVQSGDIELLALTEAEISGQWHWRWEEGRSAEWNTYKFSDMLEMHKRRCRRWEEHHNGHGCVVERVRDKYLMPRVREFLLRAGLEKAPPEASALSAGLDGAYRGKALEILMAMARLAAEGKSLTIATDWGFGSATVIDQDGAHTHVGCDSAGSEQANFESFVSQLHGLLVAKRGLSWVKPSND